MASPSIHRALRSALVASLFLATMAIADNPYDVTASLKATPEASSTGRFTVSARVVARDEAETSWPGQAGGLRFGAKAVLDAVICADTLFRDEFE